VCQAESKELGCGGPSREPVHTLAAAAVQDTWSARARCWMRARAWACAARALARCTPPPAPPRCPAARPLAPPRCSCWLRTAPRRPTGAARGPGPGSPPCNRAQAAASGLCEGKAACRSVMCRACTPLPRCRPRSTDMERSAGQGRPWAHRAALGGRKRPVRGGRGAAGGGGRRAGRAGGGRRRRRRAWRSAPGPAAGDAGARSSRPAACGPRVRLSLHYVSAASACVVAASLRRRRVLP